MRAAAALLVLLVTAPAAAQTEPEELEARAMFEAGQTAVAERRLEDARRLFERSLELHPTAAAAFNAAVVAREDGDPTAAARHLAALLDGVYGPLPEDRRARVQRLLDQTLEQVGTLVIRAEAGVALTLDGRRIAAGDEATFHLAPGEHVLEVTLPGRGEEPRRRRIELAPGERRVVDLVVEQRVEGATREPTDGDAPASTTDPGGGPDVGVIVGLSVGAALLVGGAIAIGVGVHESQRLPDEFVGSVQTLTARF